MLKEIITLWRCVFGPKLYQTFSSRSGSESRMNQPSEQIYKKNTAESVSDHVFLAIKISLGIFKVTWPMCFIHFYRKGSLTTENAIVTLRMTGCLIIISAYFMLLRGVGRFVNSTYKEFIREYSRLSRNSNAKERQLFLSKFDFSLSQWTPDYVIDPATARKAPINSKSRKSNIYRQSTLFDRIIYYPTLILGYICVHTFGRRMMFPGSLQFLQKMIEIPILTGRSNLIVQRQGQRRVLKTADGNHIDTIFVDRRNLEYSQNASTLVIACEGNAGFYEIGCMSTPLESDYSVLGWNRPGFGESSGCPGVLSEINAIDSVMQYAINELGFPVEKIVIFAWSIGGYSACWVAANYQNIRGLVLDAIFDDVLPLAQQQMPVFAGNFVEKTIRHYLDLNNVELLKIYNGPFYLIRRTHDEIISLSPGRVETNRGNEVLFEVLRHRFPKIYNDDQALTLLRRFLCAKTREREIILHDYCPSTEDLQTVIESYKDDQSFSSYPSNFGEQFSSLERQRFCVYIIAHHLISFDSQHCTPLPQQYFRVPQHCI